MTEPERPLFSTNQRKMIGFAVGLAAFLAIIALIVLIFMVLSRIVGHFSGVLWPLAIAGIVALMLRPMAGALERRLHVSRVISVVILPSQNIPWRGKTVSVPLPHRWPPPWRPP